MKKNKIIGVLVAVLGVGVAASTSFALYTSKADDQSFNITLTTPEASTEAVTYSFGDVVNSLGANKLNPTNRTQTYTVPLEATYGTEIIAQDFIVGKLDVALTGTLADYLDISAKVIGYTENTVGASTYGGDFVFTENSSSKEVAVKVDGTQKIQITLTLKDSVTAENYLTYAEKDYNVAITWGKTTQFKYAHIVGDATAWAAWDEYKMVPNINAANWEWTFKDLTGFTQLKLTDGDGNWLNGDNIVADKNTTYQVYWTGSLDAELTAHEYDGIDYISAQ